MPQTDSWRPVEPPDNPTARADTKLHALVFLATLASFLAIFFALLAFVYSEGIPQGLRFLVVGVATIVFVVLGGRGYVDTLRESERLRSIELKDVITGLSISGIVAFGLALAWGGVWGPARTKQIQAGWPTVQGTILSSEGIFKNKWHPEKPTIAHLNADFAYEVGGQTFTGHQRVEVGREKNSVEEAELRFPLGSTVAVYYNPDDSADAVIVPGGFLEGGQWYFGFLFVVVGVGLLLLGVSLIVFRRVKGRAPDY